MSDESPREGTGPQALPHRPRRHRRRGRGGLRLLHRQGGEAGPVPGAVRGPGARDPHLVRQHLHRMRRGCGLHVKTREGRAIKLEGNPDAPGQRGEALRPRPVGAAGALQPRAAEGADGPPGRWQLQGHHLGRGDRRCWPTSCRAPAARLAVISGAGRGTFTDLLAAWTEAQGGTVVRYQPSASSRCGPPISRSSALPELPAYDFARGQVHRLLRRRLPGRAGSPRWSTSAASPKRTASPTATWPST